ncbi:MAG: glycosyltransferase family 4 protein [Actinomycetota bacterium]
MKLLMVTPYPPYRDGIGTYAVQEVRRLRAEGIDVEVLSPVPSAAHHHLALGTLRGVLALTKRARRYERTMIQFSPEMFFGSCRGPLERVAVWNGLEALARVTRLEIRQHEIEWGPLSRNPAERWAAARALRAADVVSVHTQGEVDRLTDALAIDEGVVTLVEHGRNFVQATTETQAEARAELGLGRHRHQFLAIGFLQEHKGFDRAAEAFRAAGLAGQAELHVVGSVRVNHPDLLAHAKALHRLAASIPGVEVHERYVSDEEFDRWILAADTVVLPYREIWSSSVLERAKLLERPIIAADVGGLGDQAPEGTLFFDDAESLAQCLKERAATTVVPLDSATAADVDPEPTAAPLDRWNVAVDAPDRASLEDQIRRRARTARGASGLTGRPADAVAEGAAEAAEPLLRLEELQRPALTSTRRGVSAVKRTVRRLLDWELAPVVRQVDELQQATTEAVGRLDAALGRVGTGERAGDRRPPAPIPAGRAVVEDPFVHTALGALSTGARVLLVGGAGSSLAAELDAAGFRLTVVDPGAVAQAAGGDPDPVGEPSALGEHDAVVALSAAGARAGLDHGAWLTALRRGLADGGRLVVSLERRAGDESTPPQGLKVLAHRMAVESAGGRWRVVAEAPAGDARRLVMAVTQIG